MRIKFSRSFKILGIVVASIIVLILIVRSAWNLVETRKLNAAVEKIKAEGKPIEIKDFEVQCDDSENAALPWKEIEKMFSLRENKQVSDALEKALDGKTLESEEKAKISEIISENKPSLEKFKEVIKRPHFKYETDWDKSPYEFIIPRATKIIGLMRLYCLDAFFKAEEGRLEDGIDQCLSWLKFSSTLQDEPFLISYLIRIAVTKYPLTLLNTIISSRRLNDDALLSILNTLNSDGWQKGLTRSIETEGASIYSLFKKILEGKAKAKEVGLDIYSYKFLVWLFRPVLQADLRYSLKLFDEMVETSKMPYFEFAASRESYEEKYNKIPRYYVLTRLLTPNVESAFLKETIIKAKILAARAGIACKIFQNRHRVFPVQLSQLVPEMLSEIPTDPFSGKPLIYRRTPSGFIVYSVGSNGKDDGGRETRMIKSLMAEKDDDWAWYEEKK